MSSAIALACLLAGAPAPAVSAVPQRPAVILDASRTFWRFRTVRETEETLVDGKVGHVLLELERDVWSKNPGAFMADKFTVKPQPMVRLPADTPANWMKADFDASAWIRAHGPLFVKSQDVEWKMILMRGEFEVADPARAGGLRLSLTFRGGAVVYLNGDEVARAFMPQGPLDVHASAEPYPTEIFLDKVGYLTWPHDDAEVHQQQVPKRIRALTDFAIPAAKLRKGVNTLAIGIYRAPADPVMWTRRIKRYPSNAYGEGDIKWCRAALLDVQLTAPPGAAVVPNVELVRDRGFKAWNQSIIQNVFLPDYPDPFSTLRPIRLAGVRNGTFAGQVVIGDDRPIRGLRAVVSDVRGPGVLPASAARVRYGVPDGRSKPPFFDSLEDEPLAEVPVYPEHGGAVQPLWVTVSVPPDAPPGDYTGAVTVSAEGVRPLAIPINLTVIDWSLPPIERYTATLDIIQSPESVAMAYDVPLWSEAHFKLLDRTFALLGSLGVKTVYITCIRRTHFGNQHALVRWFRNDEGELTPDLTIVEKYLDVATKHLRGLRGVVLYCWEPPESQGHAGVRTWDKQILITVVDPETGELSERQGPAWGTPECRIFWKRLTDAMTALLKKRGLEDAMLFGLIGDSRPTKVAMDDIANGVPNDRWAIHSHLYCDEWQGHKLGMVSALWGIGCQPGDPSRGYSFGWSNPLWLAYYPREMSMSSTLVEHRTKLENWMGALRGYSAFLDKQHGPRGLGRIGGDFWDVLKDARGRVRGSLAGRYPEAAWGQLNLNFCISSILGKGRNGAVATVRSEAFREGLQEVEARIYVEKALLDDEAKSILGDDLLARCRRALDDRIRFCLHSPGEGEPWYVSSGWNERSRMLFGLAAEISKKLGREPRPNLTPEPRPR
jgi:hypothetical protein